MKNLAIVISFGLFATSSALALSFKTTINTVNVPKLFVSQKLPEIRYSQPGEMSINVKRMCGDGDVAHHEQANPNFKYVAQDQDSVTAILGSWIVKEGESVLPSVENWIPIGYTELEVPMWPAAQVPVPEDQAYRYEVEWIKNAGQFRLVNGLSPDPTNKEIDGLTVLSDNIPKLMDFAKQRMDKTNKYRIYSGIFVCVDPANKDTILNGGDEFKAGIMDIAYSFADPNFFSNEWADSQVESGTLPDSFKFKVKDASAITLLDDGATEEWSIFKEANGGQGALEANFSGEKAYLVAKKILDLQYPLKEDGTPLDTVSEYNSKNRTGLGGQMTLTSVDPEKNDNVFYNEVCKSDYLNLKGNVFFWEKVGAMDSACRVLGNMGLKANLKVLFHATAIPDENIFKEAKENAVKAIYRALLGKAVQVAVNNEDNIKNNNHLKYALSSAKPHCFTSEPLINEMIYSIPFVFKAEEDTAGAKKWVMGNISSEMGTNYSIIGVHPEPLFSLRNFFNDYTSSTGNQHTIFGMVNTPKEFQENPASMGIPTDAEDVSFDGTFGRALDIEVRIRSVGGRCPIFC